MLGEDYKNEIKNIRKERENLFSQKIRESQTYKLLSLSSENAQTDLEKKLVILLKRFDNDTNYDLFNIRDWDKSMEFEYKLKDYRDKLKKIKSLISRIDW